MPRKGAPPTPRGIPDKDVINQKAESPWSARRRPVVVVGVGRLFFRIKATPLASRARVLCCVDESADDVFLRLCVCKSVYL